MEYDFNNHLLLGLWYAVLGIIHCLGGPKTSYFVVVVSYRFRHGYDNDFCAVLILPAHIGLAWNLPIKAGGLIQKGQQGAFKFSIVTFEY